jgi:DNA-binding XRE family transcriptional regulator
MSVQVIENNGKPEYAVLPYADYLQLVEQADMLQDLRDYDRIKAEVENGDEETIPAEVVYALVDGENPVKVWREYRGFTQVQLTSAAGISTPYLSQIESGKRKASTRVLVAIARFLKVSLDDLVQ